jgi:hypothetical protein
MMKRLKLALQLLFGGAPIRELHITGTMPSNVTDQPGFDCTKQPPVELLFSGLVQNEPPVKVFSEERFRVSLFPQKSDDGCDECGGRCHWLVLELSDGDEWRRLVTMHESRLVIMQDVLNDVARFLVPSPRFLPRVTVGGKTYYVDARLKELRNVENPHDHVPFIETLPGDMTLPEELQQAVQ